MKSISDELRDLWVVVTRPTHQAEGIARKIEQHAGHVLRFPVIEITAPIDRRRLHSILHRLPEFDWLVFISANAVVMGLRALEEVGCALPKSKVAAIGRSTRHALETRGWHVDVSARPPFTSEALLQELALRQVRRQRFLIFRGEGGREVLREALLARGAEVEYAECYRRITAPSDPQMLRRAWSRDQLDVIMLTSVEGLKNLLQIIGRARDNRLLRTPIVVAGERVAAAARDIGWQASVITAADATEDAMLESLRAWRAGSVRAN